MYADIIISISHEKLDKSFQYHIPEKLEGRIEPGVCVKVPFGMGNKVTTGYCIGLSDKCQFDPAKIKDILGVEEKSSTVEEKMLALAGWIKKYYGSTMIQALKTVLPAKQSVAKLVHKTILLVISEEEAKGFLYEFQRKKQKAKERLLTELIRHKQLPQEIVSKKLNISPSTIESLRKEGIIQVEVTDSYRNPVKAKEGQDKTVTLSEEQQRVIESVMEDYDRGNPGTYLLHGITGSGKTEVYMNLIDEMIYRGKQAIVLIPEIALTYQTLMRFFNRFGDRVSVMNSTLSPGEKYDQCERAKKGEIDIIIGPRSALFTPFGNLGLIIIDEEHEGSYKSESTPKYHARETAIQLASLHGASVLLGSATPSVSSFYRAKQGNYKLFTMTKRLTGGSLPKVHIADMREELKEGNRSMFSRKLQELMQDRLEKKQQIMLFLNRRGLAGFVSCRSCGEVMKCPHCDVALSEHRGSILMCHYCGYTMQKPPLCPKCGSKYVMGFKAGTQQIEEKLQEMYPGVRTLRMDRDTTKTKESYEQILDAFANREADVLIGTQMIVKGHDFPNVTLVGVVAADLSLGSGDFRAGERTFELLTQAVGRAGRGSLPGEAVIQTYQPEHYAITYAANQDYEGYYQEEILYRELGGYPPVEHLLAVQVFAGNREQGENLAKSLAGMVESWRSREKIPEEIMILGPAPGSIERINDIFRFAFYIKHENYDRLIQIKDYLEQIQKDMECKNISVQFDFDPLNIL